MDRERIARMAMLGLGLLTAAGLGLGFATLGWVASEMPSSQAERVRGPHDLVGVRANATYAWVVPTDDGVVLIDTGMEPGGASLIAEVAGRKVQAILLTHAHADHLMGLSAFPDAPVWVSAADRELLTGARQPRGWLSGAIRSLAGSFTPPTDLHELPVDEDLTIDGVRFHVVAVPGHTDGSVAFLWEDVLFSGDALWGGPQVMPAPGAMADDAEQATKSLEKLVPLDFDDLADGHVGYTTGARSALLRLVEHAPEAPTISVRSGEVGPTSRALVRTGVLVRSPAPDARGDQPELLLLDGEPIPWRLSPTPVAEHDALVGQRVRVKARRSDRVDGPGVPMDVVSMEPAPDTARPLPPEGTLEGLSARAGRWVAVSGKAEEFSPLEPGAAWGEGVLVLADGARVPLAAPVDAVVAGQAVATTARVVPGPSGPRLIAVDDEVSEP